MARVRMKTEQNIANQKINQESSEENLEENEEIERIQTREDTNFLEMLRFLDRAYRTKTPVGIIGKYGIGKSQMIYAFAKKKAQEEGRELKIWHELSEEEKKEVFEHPERYFVLVDIKLQSIGDPTKLTGLPLIEEVNTENGKDRSIIWALPLFLKVLSLPNIKGMLFLDEINMALPSLQSTAFELILQKKVGEWKLNDDVFVVAAGNPTDVNIAATKIPAPLINRMAFIDFDQFISLENWLNWAIKNKIDSRITGFLRIFKEEFIHTPYDDIKRGKESVDTMKPSTTPRSWEMLSRFIEGEENRRNIELASQALLHPETAVKFMGFIDVMSKLNYRDYLKKPEKFGELEHDKKGALITLIVKNTNNIKPQELIPFIGYLAEKFPDFLIYFFRSLESEGKLDYWMELNKYISPEIKNKFLNMQEEMNFLDLEGRS
jgi:MoxR-like ATPase